MHHKSAVHAKKDPRKLDVQHHNSHAEVVSCLRLFASCMHFPYTSAMMHLDGSSITKNIVGDESIAVFIFDGAKDICK